MSFDFFTLGGSQLWEDVFFYQKWRIQRHYRTKKYRLLDNWDIRRASGSFEDCRKAFVKYIEVYEIPRQKGELVILLHGLGQTKSIFRPLWKALAEKGYNVAAINYPSTRKSIKHIINQLEFFLVHTEDISKVSFITKGAGCLVLRHLISISYGWQDKFRVSKVININPINTGSDFFELLSRHKIFNTILGPMLKESTPKYAKAVSKLPHEINLGLLFCETWATSLKNLIVDKFKSFPLNSEVSEVSYSDKHKTVKCNSLNIFKSNETISACLDFINKGSFD